MGKRGGAREDAGRKEFEPTDMNRAWVNSAVAVGIPQSIIRLQVINPETGEPIDEKTLRKAFDTEMSLAKGEYARALLQTAYEIATDKDHKQCVYMNRFLCATRLGLKETTRSELTGPGGVPLETPKVVIVEGAHPSQGGDGMA